MLRTTAVNSRIFYNKIPLSLCQHLYAIEQRTQPNKNCQSFTVFHGNFIKNLSLYFVFRLCLLFDIMFALTLESNNDLLLGFIAPLQINTPQEVVKSIFIFFYRSMLQYNEMTTWHALIFFSFRNCIIRNCDMFFVTYFVIQLKCSILW